MSGARAIWHLEPVASPRQRRAFMALQLGSLLLLLGLSAYTLDIFLRQFYATGTVYAVIALYALSVTVWQAIYVYRMLAMRRAVLDDPRCPQGLRLSLATTLVPSREFSLLAAKLEGMVRVDPCGNRLDLWVLDEEDDPRVKALIARYQAALRPGVRLLHFSRHGQPAYNTQPTGRRYQPFQARQKGGNINAWLDAQRAQAYDVLSFMDLDHVPRPEFYRQVLPFLADPQVGFVQAPEAFHNRDQNFITRAASLERDAFYGLLHRSYFGLRMPIVVGAHTTFRREALEAIGGFYPVHLTEDYLMMLTLKARGLRGVYLDRVIAVGELPSRWDAFLGQQWRWASGGLDLLLRYFPRLWKSFGARERLYTFSLLNYYSWGSFFLLSKLLIAGALLGGLALAVPTGLVAAIVAYAALALLGNHLWERQFFVERFEGHEGRRLLASMVSNNLLGLLFCGALFKAALRPNTAFRVTAKGVADPATGARRPRLWPLALVLAVLEAGCVLFALLSPGDTAPGMANLLTLPLALSALAGLWLAWRAAPCEREAVPMPASASTPGPGLAPALLAWRPPARVPAGAPCCRGLSPGHRKAWLRWRGRPHHGLYRLPPPQDGGPGQT